MRWKLEKISSTTRPRQNGLVTLGARVTAAVTLSLTCLRFNVQCGTETVLGIQHRLPATTRLVRAVT